MDYKAAFAFQPDRLEEGARAVEIDAVAAFEIGFRLARHDGGEMDDDIGALGDQLCGGSRAPRDRRPASSTLPLKPCGTSRRDDIGERQRRDIRAADLPVLDKPIGQLAADHAGRADDEDMHAWNSLDQPATMRMTA